MKRIINEMKLRLPAKSINESVSRSVISAFAAELDPTLDNVSSGKKPIFAVSYEKYSFFNAEQDGFYG